jgi:predicted dehydrogenase
VRAALIGAGQTAKQHLSCLKTLPGVELSAICDLSPATAEAAAERYGIRSWFTDHRAMLEKNVLGAFAASVTSGDAITATWLS